MARAEAAPAAIMAGQELLQAELVALDIMAVMLKILQAVRPTAEAVEAAWVLLVEMVQIQLEEMEETDCPIQ